MNTQSPTIEPLVFTSKGNLPASSLQYRTSWEFDKDGKGFLLSVRFIEEYWQGEECVKRSVHAYDNTGVAAQAQQGGF